MYEHEIRCLQYVYDCLRVCPEICLYTPRPMAGQTVPVLSLNIGHLPAEQVASVLDEKGIAVRAGLHCAPAAHRHFGTLEQGTVRLAPSVFSTQAEAEYICKVFLEIAKKSLH